MRRHNHIWIAAPLVALLGASGYALIKYTSHPPSSAPGSAVTADDLALPDMPRKEDPPAVAEAIHPPASGESPSGNSDSSRGSTIPEQLLVDIHEQLENRVGQEEADFRMALGNAAGDWEEVKRLIAERAQQTGQDYRPLLMELGIGTGQIPPNELMELLDAGIPLPDNAFDHLKYQAELDLIEGLANRGIVVDWNAPDPITGTNVLGNYVRNVGDAPFKYTEEQIADSLDRFLALGVTSDDGFRQALESANPSNAEQMRYIADLLMRRGVVISAEHRRKVENMRDGPYKAGFVDLIDD